MKIALDELKKAIQWIESNSKDLKIEVYTFEQNKLTLKCMDKLDQEVEITMYSEGSYLPKIKKTDILR